MTNPQANYLIKKCEEILNDFFKENNNGLDFIYDVTLEMPSLIIAYQSQIGDDEYNKIKDQLNKYKKALAATRELNKINHVFS